MRGPARPRPPYALLLPAFALYGLFVLYPFADTIAASFTRWDGVGARAACGLANYRRALASDPVLGAALIHNLIYLGATLLLEVAVGLALALAIEGVRRAAGLYRTLIFSPLMLSLAVIGLLWNLVYDLDYGLLNGVLRAIGLGGLARSWLGDRRTALAAVCATSGWTYAGFYMVIFSAGLRRIPREVIDAARVDGAEGWRITRHIALPLLREFLLLAALLCTTGAFRAFDLFYVMTRGGPPPYATEIIPTWIIRRGFERGEMGYGSALSALLGLGMMAVALAYVALRRRAVPWRWS